MEASIVDDDGPVDEQVEAVPAVGRKALVVDGQRDLLKERHAPQRQLVRQTALIDGLEKPRAQDFMDINGTGNHRAGERIRRVPHGSRPMHKTCSK